MARYSLADYVLTVKIPEEYALQFGTTSLSIGGRGNYLDSVNVSYASTQYTTEADATGAWVHSRSLDMHGSVEVSLNQVSEDVERLKRIFNLYYQNDDLTSGLTLSIMQGSTEVCTAEDCFITQIPQQQYQSTPQNQTWTFTSGRITMR